MTKDNDSLLQSAGTVVTNETTNVDNTDTTVDTTQSDAVDQSGTQEPSFFDSLPEELKKFEPTLGKFSNNGDLAKSYVELSNKLGKRFEDMSEDEIVSLNGKFGVPQEADGYDLKDSDNIVDVAKLSGDLKTLGIPQHLGQKILEHLKGEAMETAKKDREDYDIQLKTRQDETINALKQEYGLDFDNKIKLAKSAILNEENGQNILDKLNKAGLGDDIDIIKMFVNRGNELSEDKLLGENVGTFGMSPGEAAEEIARLKVNPDFLESFSNVGHPNHEINMKKFEYLSKIRSSGK